MSLKVNFLFSHLNYFPENLGAVSEKQNKRFHQDLKSSEKRYQGEYDGRLLLEHKTQDSGSKNSSYAKKCSSKCSYWKNFHPYNIKETLIFGGSYFECILKTTFN